MRTLLVFLHGSGGSGPDLRTFLEIAPLEAFQLKTFRQLADMSNIDILTPTAPMRPYEAALKQPMSIWFQRSSSFMSHGPEEKYEDTSGVEESLEQVTHCSIFQMLFFHSGLM